MKKQTLLRSVALAGLAGCALMIAGCASTPADRAIAMSDSVVSTGKQLDASSKAVTQVLTTLNQLVTQPSGDMVGQYKSYLASVDSLVKTSDQVHNSIQKMLDASQIYFADWSNQVSAISDPTLRQLNADRRQQAQNNLAELQSSLEKARAAYKPLTQDLQDIGTYLGNNLTADGINALKPRLAAIKVEALNVRDAITGVVASLNKFSGTLSTPPPPK